MSSAPVAGIGDAGRPGSTIPAATLLAAWRAFAVVFFSACALAEIIAVILFVGRDRRLAARTEWLHRWCRFACRVLGIRVTTLGAMPRSGLLVCNHLSYLDIIVLSSIRPCIFVAKRDVAGWPLFGWLAHAAGTIFVDRQRPLATAFAVNRIHAAIATGLPVVLFPEGTSSDGSTVLPFKSSLLESAVQLPRFLIQRFESAIVKRSLGHYVMKSSRCDYDQGEGSDAQTNDSRRVSHL